MTKTMKTINTLIATGAIALSLGLFACGGQQAQTQGTAQQETAQQETTQQQTEATATENTKPAEPAATPEATAPAQTADSYIGDAEAKRIALTHAGVSESDCHELEVELDYDDAVVHYDVNFKVGNMEYDYDIDAVTGAILTNNVEYDD